MTSAYRDDSNQSMHPHSLIRVLFLSPEEMLNPWLPKECPLKTDQTVWIHKQIKVFDWLTFQLVPFAGNWLLASVKI